MLAWAIGLSLGRRHRVRHQSRAQSEPRIIHAILPIPKKAANDWSYATVPVIGPLVGGAVAGLLARVVGF
jgi:glycerol uptake facilitator protein